MDRRPGPRRSRAPAAEGGWPSAASRATVPQSGSTPRRRSPRQEFLPTARRWPAGRPARTGQAGRRSRSGRVEARDQSGAGGGADQSEAGRSRRMERAVGPLPIRMSSLASSMAEYSVSSTERCRRWISSMKRTSPSWRSVSSAARSPARVSTGPEVMRRPAPISVATIPAREVLPSPGGRQRGDGPPIGDVGAPPGARSPSARRAAPARRTQRVSAAGDRPLRPLLPRRPRPVPPAGHRIAPGLLARRRQHLAAALGLTGGPEELPHASPARQLTQRQPQHLFHPDIVAQAVERTTDLLGA